MIRLASFVLAALICGCASQSEETADTPVRHKTARTERKPAAAASNGVQKPAVSYPDVTSAIQALGAAITRDDSETVRAATLWLTKQGSSAIQPAEAVVQDTTAEIRLRLACLNVLGFLGPSAGPAILKSTYSDNSQIQGKSIDCLGGIKPSTSEIVTRLIELLAHENPQLRRSAIESLGRIGKPAQRAAPKLQEILNSDAEESLRGAAKTALKKVDPRVGFRKE